MEGLHSAGESESKDDRQSADRKWLRKRPASLLAARPSHGHPARLVPTLPSKPIGATRFTSTPPLRCTIRGIALRVATPQRAETFGPLQTMWIDKDSRPTKVVCSKELLGRNYPAALIKLRSDKDLAVSMSCKKDEAVIVGLRYQDHLLQRHLQAAVTVATNPSLRLFRSVLTVLR